MPQDAVSVNPRSIQPGVPRNAAGGLRLAELLAALSVATDLGMGQPSGHAGRTSLQAVRLARALGLSDDQVSDVFYVALLRYLGCTSDAAEVAALAGDEIALAVRVGPFMMGDAAEQAVAAGVPDVDKAAAAAMLAHCEAAELLASRLGLNDEVLRALRHGFERWDGTGHPRGLGGDAIPIAVRIAVLARDVELWRERTTLAGLRELLARRRGCAYDPEIVDAFLDCPPVPDGPPWAELFDAEPCPRTIDECRLDTVLEVFADFADVKLPYALGHSRTVARLAAAAATTLGLDPADVVRIRRAALVHDLGRAGISNQVWDRPRPLGDDEWERVRLHPYYTERILHRCRPLEDLAEVAGAHHERLDGSGYFRSSAAAALDLPARILAAADVYAAMRQERPHRPALTVEQARSELMGEAQRSRLDGRAVTAVLAAAGHTTAGALPTWPAGLTDREVDVLRLACRGMTIQQVARRLTISAKTVDRHLQNSYAKIGVSSRAGAAVFAVGHGLLS
jgi:HD-GYP domain-containing protein (c-di-GMP phosphodiesterase class II)/DNA-binding CsgD family transcriptional regulator